MALVSGWYIMSKTNKLPVYFNSLLRSLSFVLLATVLIFANSGLAYALTEADIRSIKQGTPYYDGSDDCDPANSGGTESVSGPNANAASGEANSYPLRVPYISDGAKLATAIDAYIQSKNPNSPLKGLGKYFVQGGMRAGINPLLVVAHAQQETGFGKNGSGIASGSNNSFGRSATNKQPGVVTSRRWYQWSSFQASLYAPTFPASGAIDQPDDIFQYIARRYVNNLDNGLTSYFEGGNGLPGYGPSSDGNDVPGYIAFINKVGNEISTQSGGAIDLTKKGTATTSNGGTETPVQGSTPKGAVVAIDPGHGGVVPVYIDPVTGLGDQEYTNNPETADMQDVANLIKTELESAGYTVVMLKDNTLDSVNKRQRVDAAKQANASIAVSLHSDSGSGAFEQWGEVWPQFVGGFRQSVADPNKKVTFSNQETAKKSDEYSTIFQEERDKAERGGTGITKKVVGQSKYFPSGRGLQSYGDLSLVQLWSDSVPWVYNEVGSSATGLTQEQKQKYATGVVNAIKRSLPATSQQATDDLCNPTLVGSQGGGDVTSTALKYAWAQNRKRGSPGATDRKPEYAEAIAIAKANKQYVGGCDGVDCGAFVSRVIIDSGFDPRYNYDGKGGNTTSQQQWTRANWEEITVRNTSDLRPGDVAFTPGHTFMYVGRQPGFETEIASASLCHRAGMAGKENPLDNQARWYRKK